MNLLDRLLGHDEDMTSELLHRCRVLSDQELDRHFDIDHGSARSLLRHMIGNVEIWTDLMLGRTDTTRSVPRSIDGLLTHHSTVYGKFAETARLIQSEGRLNDTYLDVLDTIPTAKTYGGTIGHVITHNMHHRAHLLVVMGWLGQVDLPEGDLLGWESTRLK